MAATNFTPISLYYSTTASAVPLAGNLVAGELALNTLDEKLYFKNSAGTVKLLASNAITTPVTTFAGGTTGLTPASATSGAITLAGTLANTNGGTGQSSAFNQYGITYASTTSVLATTAAGTNGQVLTATTGGAPAWANPSTSGTVTSVAATVPSVFSISGSPITSSGTLAITYSGTALPVANGGTSLTTLTANNVILGNGTSAPTFVAPSTSGNVLTSNGTTWTSSALAAPTAVGSTLYLSNYYGAF
jgi:hypothetical protein